MRISSLLDLIDLKRLLFVVYRLSLAWSYSADFILPPVPVRNHIYHDAATDGAHTDEISINTTGYREAQCSFNTLPKDTILINGKGADSNRWRKIASPKP